MATTPQQGIMALPETDEANTPQLSLTESYDAAKQGLTDADPQFSQMYEQEMSKAMPALMALSDEELDMLLQLIQYLQEHPEEYAKNLQELEQSGAVDKGDLPAEYDENFLAVFGAAVMEAQRTNEDTGAGTQAMQPPMAMARGGIAEAARMVASSGRGGDTMLAHINKDEAALLKKHGGAGTLNPRTGLREYGWNPIKAVTNAVSGVVKGVGSAISGAVKAVGSAVKQVLASPIGRIAATVALAAFIGPAAFGLSGAAGVAAQMGLASAGITALSGGNLKDVIKAGTTGAVLGYGGAALGPVIGGATGVTNAAGQAALGAGAAGAGVGLLTGKSIKDSVKDGLTSAAVVGLTTGFSQGFDKQVDPATGKVVSSGPNNADVVDSSAPKTSAQIEAEIARGATQPVPGNPPSAVNGANPPAASADPLGDFITQNEAFRTAANTPVPPAPKVEPTWWDKTTDFLSPSSRAQTGLAEAKTTALEGFKADIAAGVPESIATQNYQAALKSATPGFFSNYGPAIGAGLGITALAGGFNSKPADAPQFSENSKDVISGKATQELISADPKKYITQNMPGVSYDTAGNITGSAAWTPRSGAGTTEVAGNYIPFSQTYTPPPTYTAPAGAIGGGRQIAQPYNTASMYDFRPRYAAQGGMMETQGAFPANPLTMQSNPMMGMQAHQLPMNTSGVPMNLPMGFAMGGMPPAGIATLAPGGYPRRTGQISGPGTETSDDIPAMLSDGEFVMTAKAVKGLGGGSRRSGAKKMYALMHRLEKNAARG